MDFILPAASFMPERWIERKGTPSKGFRYLDGAGRVVRGRDVLKRIEALRIPPAWSDVHIAANASATIQAWGFDARGRRQYRYHERAVQRGQLRKYHRVRRLGHELPRIRRRVERDSSRAELTRETVAAVAVRLIGQAFFRVGNERYERENGTFGLTTLRKSHVTVRKDSLVFEYRGKGSKRQRQLVFDAGLARMIARLRRAPGSRLFRYHGRKGWTDLRARDVNAYLRSIGHPTYTAKDFRTWGGTLRMATILGDFGPAPTPREAARNVALAARLVAAELGNTPAICRASYVHPLIIARYVDAGAAIDCDRPASSRVRRFTVHSAEERALLEFLDRYFPDRRQRHAPRPTTRERRADQLSV